MEGEIKIPNEKPLAVIYQAIDKGKEIEVWDILNYFGRWKFENEQEFNQALKEAEERVGTEKIVIYKVRQKYNGGIEITTRKIKIVKLLKIEEKPTHMI